MSVITPLYDRAAVVADAIRSVQEQGVDHEHVIVDDGSTDGGADLVASLAADDPRIRLFRQANAGPSAARNEGLRRARGRLVTFLDSDDVLLPGALTRQLEVLGDRHGSAAVLGLERIETRPGIDLPGSIERLPPPEVSPRWRLMTLLVSRQAVLDLGGFDEDMRIGEDIDLVMKVHTSGITVERLEEELVIRRILGDNLVYDDDAVRHSMVQAVRRYRTTLP